MGIATKVSLRMENYVAKVSSNRINRSKYTLGSSRMIRNGGKEGLNTKTGITNGESLRMGSSSKGI